MASFRVKINFTLLSIRTLDIVYELVEILKKNPIIKFFGEMIN